MKPIQQAAEGAEFLSETGHRSLRGVTGATLTTQPSKGAEDKQLWRSVCKRMGLVHSLGISISLCLLTLFAGIPLLGAAGRNPGHGTKVARGLVRYKGYRLLFYQVYEFT